MLVLWGEEKVNRIYSVDEVKRHTKKTLKRVSLKQTIAKDGKTFQ